MSCEKYDMRYYSIDGMHSNRDLEGGKFEDFNKDRSWTENVMFIYVPHGVSLDDIQAYVIQRTAECYSHMYSVNPFVAGTTVHETGVDVFSACLAPGKHNQKVFSSREMITTLCNTRNGIKTTEDATPAERIAGYLRNNVKVRTTRMRIFVEMAT
jgi:hypothetical protein